MQSHRFGIYCYHIKLVITVTHKEGSSAGVDYKENYEQKHAFVHFRELDEGERTPHHAWLVHCDECLETKDKDIRRISKNYKNWSKEFEWEIRIAETQLPDYAERLKEAIELSDENGFELYEQQLKAVELEHQIDMQKRRFALEKLEMDNALHAQLLINDKLQNADHEDLNIASVAALLKSTDSIREKILERYKTADKEAKRRSKVVDMSKLGNSRINNKLKSELEELAT